MVCTLREEHKLSVFENRVLRQIFVLKRGKVPEEWRILLIELRDVITTRYYLGVKIKKNEMGGACGIYWLEERCMQGFDGAT